MYKVYEEVRAVCIVIIIVNNENVNSYWNII